MRYKIIDAPSPEILEARVHIEVDNGYEPAGSPFIYRGCICQAIFLPDRAEIKIGSIDWESAEIMLDIDGKH